MKAALALLLGYSYGWRRMSMFINSFNVSHPTSIPWSEFPTECLWYIVVAILPHLVAFGLGWTILAFLPARQPSQFWRQLSRLGLFLAVFLVVGSLFNGLWSCLVWGRYYESSDYVCGFLPFWPPTEAWFEPLPRDDGTPASFTQLQLFWLLFTVATWGLTILVYRFVVRRAPGIFAVAKQTGPAESRQQALSQ